MNLTQFLSLGFYPGVVIAGAWLARKLFQRKAVELSSIYVLALGVPLGLIAVFPISFFLAWNGWFDTTIVGVVGWVLAGIGSAKIGGAPPRANDQEDSRNLSFDVLFPILLIIGLFAFYGSFAYESVLTGRDEGLYSNHAASIARTGSLFLEGPHKIIHEPGFWGLFESSNPLGYMFDSTNERFYAQFPPMVALAMAPAYGVAEYSGVMLFNSFIAAFSSVLFYGFLKEIVPRKWAVLGVLFFSLNVAQTWNARITLSEPLTQSILLAGFWVGAIYSRRRFEWSYHLGYWVAASAVFVRIDAFLVPALAPYVGTALIAYSSVESRGKIMSAALSATIGSWLIAVLAVVYYEVATPNYFGDFHGKLGLMGFLTVVGFGLQLSLRSNKVAELVRKLLLGRGLWIFALIAMGALIAYAYWIRPYVEPFGMFDNPSYGARDFRELTLVHLTAYVSLPVILLGYIGLVFVLRPMLGEQRMGILILVVPWLAFSLLYLYNPNISPDHIWRIRRFTPLVIPGFILVAIFAVFQISNWVRIACIKTCIFYGCVLTTGIFLYKSLAPIALFAERKGSIDLIEFIDRATPENAFLLTDLGRELLGPVQMALGRSNINMDLQETKNRAILRSLINNSKVTNQPIYMVVDYPLSGYDFIANISEIKIDIPILRAVMDPPANEVVIRSRRIFVRKLVGDFTTATSNQRVLSFGGSPNLAVEEEGVYAQGYLGDVPTRWTTKKCRFVLNGSFQHPLTSVILDTAAAKPGGSLGRLWVNGEAVAEFELPNRRIQQRFDFAPVHLSSGTLVIEIESEEWIPAVEISGSSDQRKLGVRLVDLTLLFNTEPSYGAVSLGFDAKPGISETGLYPIERIGNRFMRWTNGNAQWEFLLNEGFSPESITIDVERSLRESDVLEVFWNGEKVGEEEIGEQKRTISIPVIRVPNSRTIRLELRSGSDSPKNLGLSNDERRLGLLLSRVEIN